MKMLKKIWKALVKLEGSSRLFLWSLCPKCNSDAPEIYACRVCRGRDSRLTPWPWNKETKTEIWKRFLVWLDRS